ncbi:hypothetical protein PHJA_000606200 [Phtheirospermum japonicum]|uniref:Plant basic secretory protein (BSP) family protein n=1 Tax=Phtheirospermum japonicum TaxID=374723 RepID=A0A830BKK6_9LAMI|nr:hypothetical protein PHJA_000606200 [Phtheirospermum japonicum]
MKIHHAIFILLLQILPHLLFISSAVDYRAFNAALDTPGGARFQSEIGLSYTIEIMKTINCVIWDIFQQYNETDQKDVETVKVFIHQYNGAEAVTYGNNINVSSIYLEGYKGNLKWEFTSLLHHEMTHVFQWNGEGKAPAGLTEGMADYVMVKSNYYDPNNYDKPGDGNSWDEGYGVTARFLEYCDSLRDGFTADLNNMMREVYKDEYFQDLLGISLDKCGAIIRLSMLRSSIVFKLKMDV